MKKTVKWILVIGCIGALAVLLALSGWQRSRQLFGARLAGREQIERITRDAALTADECALYWNGVELPYNQELGAYCLPQPLEGEPTGTLSAQWGSVYLPDWLWEEDGSEAIADGRPEAVYISDGRQWKKTYVYRSGLPVIAMNSQVRVSTARDPNMMSYTLSKIPLEQNYGSIRVFWPEGNVRQQVVSTGVEWHWRGNTNMLAEKKSYRVNLLDSKGMPDSQDLTGLGADADWILLNMATDCTNLRDWVSWEIWNQMSQTWEFDLPGTRVQLVELYINDTYMGVYGLCRPIGEDSLGLSSEDTLYKWRSMEPSWSMPDAALFDQLDQDQMVEWRNYLEVSCPDVWSEGIWDEMELYISQFYTAEQADWETIEQNTNIANLIDNALFRQFTCLMDNFCYNQYFLYDSSDGRYYRIPWDLDYSWGDVYDTFYEVDLTATAIPDMELDTLYLADPQRTRQLVAERWSELRQTVFSLENVESLFRSGQDRLERSGAMGRDYALWGRDGAYGPEPHFRTMEVDETLEWLEKRLEFLDQYMADYVPPDRSWVSGLPQ